MIGKVLAIHEYACLHMTTHIGMYTYTQLIKEDQKSLSFIVNKFDA